MEKIKLNGIELAYARSGQGIPMVLIHGYPLDHTIWDPVVSLLKDDFALILPDLRGFGGSETPRGPYRMVDLAADIAALLDRLGIAQAVIAGHSMGGYVALAFACTNPERILGLGLVASQAAADPPERKAARIQTAEQVEKIGVAEVAALMPSSLSADPVLRARLTEIILHQPPAALAEAQRAMAGRPDSTPFLTGFNFPVVCIHGLADRLVPIERAYEVKRAVKQGQVIEIASAGHMPMMEAPEATARALSILL